MKIKRFIIFFVIAICTCYGHDFDTERYCKIKVNISEVALDHKGIYCHLECGETVRAHSISYESGEFLAEVDRLEWPIVRCPNCTSFNMRYYTHCYQCGYPLK